LLTDCRGGGKVQKANGGRNCLCWI